MIKPLFTNRCRMPLLILFAAILFFISPSKVSAQTTLSAGDIAFTGYHSLSSGATPDTISFVLLTNISSGTRINFTDRGYSSDGSWQAATANGSEASVTWQSGTALATGTEIILAGLQAYTYNALTGVRSVNGSMTIIDPLTTSAGLALAGTGDQVIAYQSPGGAASTPNTAGNTFIAGIHYGYCNASTNATNWDDLDGAGPGACSAGPNSSYIPPGLTNGTSAMYIPTISGGDPADCAKFNCTGTPALNAAAVRTALYNVTNWTRSNTTISMAANCLFVSSGPTITGHPANRTVCVNASTTFTVTATNPGTYQWQEDNGGGFVDITPGAPFSGVNTATLTINPIGAGRNGYRYRCRVTNGTSVNSNPATLTVDVVAGTSAVTSVSCNGGSNGTATITVTSGILPIASYSWSPSGGTSASASGLTANTYTCTITDNIGCTGTVQAIITEPAQPVSATITTVNNVSCPGGTNGNMTVTPSGGTPGYTYLWNTTGTTASIFGLTAGTYTVTVRDSKNCPTTASATVTAPPAFVTSSSSTPVSCNGGGNGTATVTVSSGGQAPYTYQWSASAGSQSTATATGLTAGTYSVTVRDNNLCPTVVSGVTVSQPTDFTVGTSQTNVSCNGGNNGTATVSVSGATAPYTYSWSPSGGTNAMATGLAMGTYTVTIRDNNTCETSRTFNITQPAAALGGIITKTDVSCNGGNNGTATVSVTGGTTPYSYSWSPSGGTNATAIGLAMGTYTVTVTDFNGCQITRTTTVNQPAAALGGIISKTDVSCNGGNNGTATVNVNGGTTPYSYSWAPSGGTNATAIGLAMGTYTVTVTDFNGCQITRTTTVNQPAAALGGTISKTDVSCNGGNSGTATVSVTGGTTPYSYSWSPSGGTNAAATGLVIDTYTVTVTDFNGCQITRTTTINQPAVALSGTTVVTDAACFGTNTGAINLTPTGGTFPYTYNWGGGITTKDRTLLAAGNYSVTITDANGCTAPISASVTEPSALTGLTLVSSTNVSCFGGSNATASVTTAAGGTGTITYDWAPGTPTGDGTTSISGLLAGTYTVTATDGNGCTKSLAVPITQPSALAGLALVSSTNVSCFGGSNGSASVTAATGGTGTITYDWTPGTPTGDGTTSISGLTQGTYTITATDGNSCTRSLPVTITEPTALAGLVLASSFNVSCNGGANGSASVTAATGGTGTITYDWTPGTPTGDGTTSISGLTQGTYTVTATDNNGCTKSLAVPITEPSALAGLALVSSTNVSCFGGSNGSASVTAATGGTGTITYDWTPGTPTGDGTTSISGLTQGTYTITATDGNSCTRSLPVTITQPSTLAGLTLVSSTNVSCFGGSNGSASVTAATGGTGTITYDWTPGTPTGDGTTSISGLSQGTYTVTATDNNGCTKSLAVPITQPSALAGLTLVSSTNVSCFGGSNGSASVTAATGGTGTITYDWTPGTPTGDGTTSISGLSQGTYTVTATDNNGCTKSLAVPITQPSALAGLALVSSTNVSCFGGSNGSASVTAATGGTGTITYDWTPGTPTGDGTTSISGLLAGTYTVTATDGNGCTKSLAVPITQPSALAGLTLVSSTNVSCFGGSNGSASVTAATGGTGTITYDWTPGTPTGDGTTSISGLTQGTYTITATDINSCTRSLPVTITEPTALAGLVLASSFNVSCNGGANGSASVTPVTGGTGAITYDWTPGTPIGDGTTSISGLTQGTYTVTATDINGCTKSLAVPITQPDPLALTPSQNNLTCNGISTGSATVAVTGGTGAYTYSWSPSGGTSATASGLAAGSYTVTIRDINLCETSHSFIITQPALAESSLVATACDSYTLNGTTYTTSGTYTQVLNNAAGCDSTITLNLTVKYATASSMSATACDSYTLNGTTYTTSGTYVQTLTNAAGCDSTLTLNLTVKYTTASSMSATACDSYTLNGTTYTTSGTYVQTLTNAAGCDSTLTLNLTVNYASAHSFAATACDSYTLNGTTYTTSGTYIQTLPNASGCDSTLTLNLTVKYATASSMSATACDSYTLNGTTYTTSGIYTQVIPNAVGCDSTITLDLTINYSTSYTLTATGCDSYTLNGQTYTASGTYTQVLTNQVGCDWNFTLILTINHSTATSLTQVACGNYTLNGQTYTTSGVYTQTFENAAGCDSIVTLNLTIKQPTGSSLTETACGSFTLNNQTYNTSGTYTQTFVNSVGCDSIVTLHLTIKTVNVNVETNGFVIASEANNATYQWLNCNNFTPISGATSQSYTVTANGDYAVVVTQNGCTDTSACVPVYGVSITENDIKNIDVTIYPNPTLDYVYIQTDGVIKSIDVMDISGKKYQPHFSVGKLDLTTMPSGIYLVRVTLNNGQQALTRVIKM